MRGLWCMLVLAVLGFGSPAAAGCAVTRVVDGDTLHLTCAGGTRKVRLMGFDTPEMHRPRCAAERQAAVLATAALRRLVASGPVTGVVFAGKDRYGRDLARLAIAGRDVAWVMLASGLARPYQGGRRKEWCGGA